MSKLQLLNVYDQTKEDDRSKASNTFFASVGTASDKTTTKSCVFYPALGYTFSKYTSWPMGDVLVIPPRLGRGTKYSRVSSMTVESGKTTFLKNNLETLNLFLQLNDKKN